MITDEQLAQIQAENLSIADCILIGTNQAGERYVRYEICRDPFKDSKHFNSSQRALVNSHFNPGFSTLISDESQANEKVFRYCGFVLKLHLRGVGGQAGLLGAKVVVGEKIVEDWQARIDGLIRASEDLEISQMRFLILANTVALWNANPNTQQKLSPEYNENMKALRQRYPFCERYLHMLQNYYLEMSTLSVFQVAERKALMEKYSSIKRTLSTFFYMDCPQFLFSKNGTCKGIAFDNKYLPIDDIYSARANEIELPSNLRHVVYDPVEDTELRSDEKLQFGFLKT